MNPIKQFREEHKMTQEKLAKLLLIPRSSLRNYEFGQEPPLTILLRFAKLTGKSLDELAHELLTPERESEDNTELSQTVGLADCKKKT